MFRAIRKSPRRCKLSGKIGYRDEESARRAVRDAARKTPDGYIPVRWYECGRCGQWHLTSRQARP